jgi:hypothetical protein
MTTHGDIGPYWFTRTAAEIAAAIEARGEAWAAVPGYSRYEWSDKGRWRRVACTDGQGRRLGARFLSTTPGGNGYVNVNVMNDRGEKSRPTIHAMVLLAHHPAFRGLDRFPEGLETRHGPAGPLCNAYPENLWPGTKKENAGDRDEQEPQHECRNFAACGNMVYHEGKRCVPCTGAVGREAAELLNRGANLMAVAEHFGYSGPDWVFKLAVQHGAYEGTKAAALAQHPGMVQRVRLRAAGLRLTQGGASR